VINGLIRALAIQVREQKLLRTLRPKECVDSLVELDKLGLVHFLERQAIGNGDQGTGRTRHELAVASTHREPQAKPLLIVKALLAVVKAREFGKKKRWCGPERGM
jgi:hypothetical protein